MSSGQLTIYTEQNARHRAIHVSAATSFANGPDQALQGLLGR